MRAFWVFAKPILYMLIELFIWFAAFVAALKDEWAGVCVYLLLLNRQERHTEEALTRMKHGGKA